jgi:hypothetical protein
VSKTNRQTKKILNDNWDKIKELKDQGVKYTKIAKKFGISRQAVTARLKKAEVIVPSSDTLKILILDIENAPMMSFHWNLWQQNIHKQMRVDGNRSYMMTIAMKWLGEDEIFYFETRNEDDSELIAKVLPFINEADLIVGHNAKKFDMKKINAYAILNGLLPPSPYRVIDTMLIAKKEFAFERNTLEYLSEALCTTSKSEHKKFTGFELWAECMKGNEEAWAEMKHYNIQDVLATEELYLVLRPWIKGHPNVNVKANSLDRRCATCGSTILTPDGYSITNVSQFRRYKCANCHSYSRGRTSIIHKDVKKQLLTTIMNG